MKTKKCLKCKEVKPLSKYYKYAKSEDGHRNNCISCYKKNQNTPKPLKTIIPCYRDGKTLMIRSSNCYPGCNDACRDCPNPYEPNRLSQSLTVEEEKQDRYWESTGGFDSDMIKVEL